MIEWDEFRDKVEAERRAIKASLGIDYFTPESIIEFAIRTSALGILYEDMLEVLKTIIEVETNERKESDPDGTNWN